MQVFVEGDSEGDFIVDIRGEPALIQPDENGIAHVLLSEATGFTKRPEEGTTLGEAIGIKVIARHGTSICECGL